jgi:hypothetical protein
MHNLLKWIMHGIVIFFITNNVFAAYDKDWLAYQKTCDEQWNSERNGSHRHVGKAVCSCMADSLLHYQLTHKNGYQNTQDYNGFYKQAFQICVTEGVFTNTVDRAVFDRVYDESTIQSLCTSSWVGLMGLFHPADAQFNSAAICQCASPQLSGLVTNFDDLSPKNLRLDSLSLVKKCDPSAALSPEQFSLLSQSSNTKTSMTLPTQGTFILDIKDDPLFNGMAKYLRKDGRLSQMVSAMNQNLKIPYDIKIIVTTSKKGSFYSPSRKTIYLDYQFMNEVLAVFDKFHAKESAKNRRHYLNNMIRFLLYHELGHALIDAYKLPVLGQEEDAADAFGAVIALKYLPQGFQVLVDTADYFSLADIGSQVNDPSLYWNEHPLNAQRYYRLLCFAYGKDPQPVLQKIKYYYKGALDNFIKERADYCQYEYDVTYHAWMTFLEPYFR